MAWAKKQKKEVVLSDIETYASNGYYDAEEDSDYYYREYEDLTKFSDTNRLPKNEDDYSIIEV